MHNNPDPEGSSLHAEKLLRRLTLRYTLLYTPKQPKEHTAVACSPSLLLVAELAGCGSVTCSIFACVGYQATKYTYILVLCLVVLYHSYYPLTVKQTHPAFESLRITSKLVVSKISTFPYRFVIIS